MFMFWLFSVIVPYLPPSAVQKRLFSLYKASAILVVDAVVGPSESIVSYNTPRNLSTMYIGTRKIVGKSSFLHLFYFMSLGFLCMIFAIFWGEFLYEVTFTCNDKTIDCFIGVETQVSNYSKKTQTVMEPVLNCSQFEYSEVDFVCYSFTYSLGSALATIGGLFTALRYIGIVISRVNIWVVRKFHSLTSKTVCQFLFLFVAALCTAALIATNTLADKNQSINPPEVLKIYLTTLWVTLLSCMPWEFFTNERFANDGTHDLSDDESEDSTSNEQQPLLRGNSNNT